MAPSLAVAAAIAGLVLPAHAQKSASCSGISDPCVQVGRMDGSFQQANFDSDADHFIYCSEGSTVEIDVLAVFQGALDCDSECSHGTRTFTWSVSGATTYSIDSQTDMWYKSFITVTLGEAGDAISIECEVSSISQGECEEDRHGNPGEHGGNHGGDTASCTIKLWRVDLEVTGETPTPPFPSLYNIEFAKSVTTKATLIGASPAPAQGLVHPWEWESWIDSQLHNTAQDSSSWSGKIVASTLIKTKATVVNGCDSNSLDSATSSLQIVPDIRRQGWQLDNIPASIAKDMNWKSGDTTAFPGLANGYEIGLNNNSTQKYRVVVEQVVTPIYVDLSTTDPVNYPPAQWPGGVPNDASQFSGKVTSIGSGPNDGFYYNSSTNLFDVDRIAQLNYWTTPNGTWPGSVPNEDPSTGNPASYTNWLDIYTTAQQSCQCSNPSSHGAAGVTDIRHVSNYWHEGPGCPGSANEEQLGHQVRMKEAIESQPGTYDALWRSDLVYRDSEDALRIADEAIRSSASSALTVVAGGLHSYTNSAPQNHNFYGFVWLYNGSAWSSPGQNW